MGLEMGFGRRGGRWEGGWEGGRKIDRVDFGEQGLG